MQTLTPVLLNFLDTFIASPSLSALYTRSVPLASCGIWIFCLLSAAISLSIVIEKPIDALSQPN